jgi:hypothetical protein
VVHVDDRTRAGYGAGPALYLGYCTRSGRYRMMDLPEYVSSVQEGFSRLVSDTSALYQDAAARLYGQDAAARLHGRQQRSEPSGHARDCRSDCHCECCVCDADVLVPARCGERRRVPIVFENEKRHEQQVRLTLEKFVTAGGRDLGWPAALSETEFTLRACEEHTVVVAVEVRCAPANPDADAAKPAKDQPRAAAGAADPRAGSVDRCEVGYATVRAEGCLVRPIVLAVAVLPDDCDAYRRPCGCGCCR